MTGDINGQQKTKNYDFNFFNVSKTTSIGEVVMGASSRSKRVFYFLNNHTNKYSKPKNKRGDERSEIERLLQRRTEKNRALEVNQEVIKADQSEKEGDEA